MERGLELRRLLPLELRGYGPVLLRLEGLYLALALDHKAKRHRLHAARAQALPDLSPEEGAEAVSHKPVQDPAGLLRLHFVHVYIAGVCDGLLDGPRRYLVEGDSVDLPARLLVLYLGGYVVGDRLALPVGVGGKKYPLGVLGGLLEVLYYLLLAGDHPVVRLEVIIHVHSELLGREVPYVSHRGLHGVPLSEDFVQGPRLCGRFNYYQRTHYYALLSF